MDIKGNKVTLTELIDMKRLGFKTDPTVNIQERDIQSARWIKNQLEQLTGKLGYNTSFDFIIDKNRKDVKLILIVNKGYVKEFRWYVSSPTEVLKVWAGKVKTNITVVEEEEIKDNMVVQQPIVEDLKYHITGCGLVIQAKNGSTIIHFNQDENKSLDILNLQDLVNLLYTLQGLEDKKK